MEQNSVPQEAKAEESSEAKLTVLVKSFLKAHRVTCEEACVNDGVYEDAPNFVHELAQIVGFYNDQEDHHD